MNEVEIPQVKHVKYLPENAHVLQTELKNSHKKEKKQLEEKLSQLYWLMGCKSHLLIHNKRLYTNLYLLISTFGIAF